MYNFNNVGDAMLLVYDELKNDKESKELIRQIDRATNDERIKDGFKKAVKRLRELGKNAVADQVQSKTKGFVVYNED